MVREWFSAAEIAEAALPGMPIEKKNVLLMAERLGWNDPSQEAVLWRRRVARGGGREYHCRALPNVARQALVIRLQSVDASVERQAGRNAAVWAWWDKQTDAAKARGQQRLRVVQALRALVQSGTPRTAAVHMIAAEYNVTASTIYNWESLIAGVDRQDWLALLTPRHVGRTKRAECSPEAWEALYKDYARLAAPNFTDCYRRIWNAREKHGWTVPSEDTLKRRMDALPPETLMLARRGREATKRMFPALERDRTVFHALEAVNADGHKWDVFVRWPDGYVGRPMMVGFQDLFSDAILSWRVDRTENKYLIQLCFGDVVERFGIPSFCYLDNGRGFTAKSLTGGIKNRFRYQYREAEPDGVMKQLGVEVHFALPYSGQSKPIERGFRDLAQTVAKDIRFEGAYCGNRPGARPEDCDADKAVPLELFLQVVGEGIHEHNTRVGRRTRACAGKLSFRQAFDASYATCTVRRATAEAKQLWLLAADQVKPRAPDSSIHFYGNRYWSQFLQGFDGRSLTVRFDPHALHESLHVYNTDGSFLGLAECREAVGFNDVDAAKRQAAERAGYFRNARARHVAELNGMTADRLVALTSVPEPEPELPEARVIRPTFRGGAALARKPVAEEDEELSAYNQMLVQYGRVARAARGDHLRVVEEDEE